MTEPVLFDMVETAQGPGLVAAAALTKSAVIADVDARTDDWWRRTCDQAIAEFAKRGKAFSAFDLVEAGVPEPEHPSRWGSRFAAAAKAGSIVPAGAGPSRRPSVRGSLVRYWRGTA